MSASTLYLNSDGMRELLSIIRKEAKNVINGFNGLPSGSIVMWSGTTIPAGWAICDGQNGTPDLRGRFVMGSSAAHAIGSSGGSETHTITVAELPAHNHIVSGVNLTADGNGGSLFSGGEDSISASNSIETSSTGNGAEMNILPPYYTLAYIMKLAS